MDPHTPLREAPETMPEPRVHHLTEKNSDELTAVCSICGPTDIRKSGTGHLCIESRRATKRAAKSKAPKQKSTPSPHRLTNVQDGRGTCAIDGEVSVVAWGRGWMCGPRFTELGWTTKQTKPQERCPACKTWLDRFGSCPQCSDRKNVDTGYALKMAEYGLRREVDFAGNATRVRTLPFPVAPNGVLVLDQLAGVDYDREKSLTPELRVLGSTTPGQVRPEYVARYGDSRRSIPCAHNEYWKDCAGSCGQPIL